MSDSSERDLRRLNRREVLYGGAAMAAALGLAACGGSDDDGGSSSATSAAEQPTSAAAPESSAAAETTAAGSTSVSEPAPSSSGEASAPESSAAETQAVQGKPGGTFRVGLTGGSAKDIIDGQNIVNKPDQARLVAGWETLLVYDREFKLVVRRPGRGGHARRAPTRTSSACSEGIEFHDGKTARRRRRRLLASSG